MALHLPPSLRVLQDQVGCEAPELSHAAVPKVSPHTTASDQVPPILRPLTMARSPAVNLSPPTWRRMPPAMMSMWRFMWVMLKS